MEATAESLSFVEALKYLEEGHRLRREAWVGDWDWIEKCAPREGDCLNKHFYRLSAGEKTFPWTPNTVDMIAADWCRVRP